jgi:hypothetical protein
MARRLIWTLIGLLAVQAAQAGIVRWDWEGVVQGVFMQAPDGYCPEWAPHPELCEAMIGKPFHGSWIFEETQAHVEIDGFNTTRSWSTRGAFSIVVDEIFALLYVGDLYMETQARGVSFFYFGALKSGGGRQTDFTAIDLLHGEFIDVSMPLSFFGYDLSIPSYLADYDLTHPPPVENEVPRWQMAPELMISGISAPNGLDFSIKSWTAVPEPPALALLGCAFLAFLAVAASKLQRRMRIQFVSER